MPEEVRFFARSAIFGLVVGVAYWFISYEAAGTILLLGFGLAGAFLALELRRESGVRQGAGAAVRGLIPLAADDEPNPFSGEGGWLPGPTAAPLATASGLALALLAIVFGPAMLVAAAAPLLVGAALWLRAVIREWRAIDSDAPAGTHM